MKTVVLLNDAAYGSERSYNGLRFANALVRRSGEEVRVFLFSDAVTCALSGQDTPSGCYNLEQLLVDAIQHGAELGLCGTCMRARAIREDQLVKGARHVQPLVRTAMRRAEPGHEGALVPRRGAAANATARSDQPCAASTSRAANATAPFASVNATSRRAQRTAPHGSPPPAAGRLAAARGTPTPSRASLVRRSGE